MRQRNLHCLKIGVSHTEGGGLSHTGRVGVTQTVFEALTEGSWWWLV